MFRVAYAGQDGSHAESALESLYPERAKTLAVTTFRAVVHAVENGEADRGVLAIENTLIGSVGETHDLLYESALTIVDEVRLPIRHCLVGQPGARVDSLRVIRSHPAALDQCRDLLAGLPGAVAIAAATTAEAARLVATAKEPTEAAIASERAAELQGLAVLAADVGDDSDVFTRFVAVASHLRLDRGQADADWRIAFSFLTDHQPGALMRVLAPFERHGLDLIQLVSRPLPRNPWRYRFDAILGGHPLDPEVASALKEVQAQTRHLKLFGSYPAALVS
jgi:prephenate dehydratase